MNIRRFTILVSPKCHKIGQRHFGHFERNIKIIFYVEVPAFYYKDILNWEMFVKNFFDQCSTPLLVLKKVESELPVYYQF